MSGTGCAPQPKQVGHLFPRLLGQSEYNQRLKAAAPLMETALRWLADADAGQRGDAAADGRHACPVRPVGDHREAL